MARSRNIKPSFFLNEQLADNEPLGRLLFAGLWTIADFRGNLEWRPRRIKVQILPHDDCDILALAINLDKSGLIRFYTDGDLMYVNIKGFEQHQNPHKNERDKGSSIPGYSEEMRQAIDLKGLTINPDKSRSIRNSSHSAPADSLNLIPDSGSPQEHISSAGEIFEYWQKIMNHPQSKFTKDRKAKVEARLKEGYTKEQIIQAIDGCASSEHHMGKNDQGTVYDDLTLICRNGSKLEWFMNNIGKVTHETDQQQRLSVEQALRDEGDESWAETRGGSTEDDYFSGKQAFQPDVQTMGHGIQSQVAGSGGSGSGQEGLVIDVEPN